ncbi:formate dehydrogenase subunit delta [Nannocystis sp. SCPEA4]|uniref:formate dehydrogenase subunit delta n=1 Tax=Nannocystis sp. SCPEA4 TaxID=2996787 RepID=UPI00226D7ABF|nr:formate dehydrogenase subunit delta [Nannocystis sp. SCPEA4]MCY1056827.1 formate dehydrogenase subunit delta [Nannocystis sp. SCPEA4]
MDAHKLVKMANDIATFFESDPDPAAVTDGIAGHLRRFWDPRMRRALVRHIDEHAGEGCKPTVLAAVAGHRDALAPPAP